MLRSQVLLVAFFLIFRVCPGSVITTDTTGNIIRIPFSESEILIDGNTDDWETYSTYTFRDTSNKVYSISGLSIEAVYPGLDSSGIRVPLSRNEVTVRFCWNYQDLYIAFSVKDGHLLGQWKGRDENPFIYLNDAIEIYIDTRNDSRKRMDINDYQFIVDVNNQVSCFRGTLSLINIDTLSVPKEHGQNLVIHSSVVVNGEINGHYDHANGYTAEIRIPFATIGMEPRSGDTIGLDIGNDDADYVVADLSHPKHNLFTWAFNWSGLGDMGYPACWKKTVLEGQPSFYTRVSEQYKKFWLPVLLFTVLFSLLIMVILYFYSRKQKRLPPHNAPNQKKIVISGSGDESAREDLSYNRKILSDARKFIVEHAQDPLRSDDIASHIGITLRSFQRITRKELDCTPTNFIYIIKLQLASEFLKLGKGNVSEAAFEFGFSDPGYFSKLFRKHFGISPGGYADGSR